jgi:hypothetical protein
MQLFTNVQTESWQRDIIAGATKVNDLASLCWFVQMILPPPSKAVAKTMTQQERIDYRYRTACAPGLWIPYIPVGDSPEASRAEAEILAGIFAYSNAPHVKFAPALCLTADIEKQCSYVYGRTWDHVCSRCGIVFTSTLPNETRICINCNYHFYRMAML